MEDEDDLDPESCDHGTPLGEECDECDEEYEEYILEWFETIGDGDPEVGRLRILKMMNTRHR